MAYDLHVRRLKNVTCTHCRTVKKRDRGRIEKHESVWTCYVIKQKSVYVHYKHSVLKTFCRHCWDEQMSYAMETDWRRQFTRSTKFHVISHGGALTEPRELSRPWWLYLPGYSPLTHDEQTWTRELSSLLGTCLSYDSWGAGEDGRHAVGCFPTCYNEWAVHPARDYCGERDIECQTFPLAGNTHYVLAVYFAFPPRPDSRSEDEKQFDMIASPFA